MIVDLDSMSRENSKRQANSTMFRFSRSQKALKQEELQENSDRIEDASIVFSKLKQHVTGFQDRLVLKVEALNQEKEAASKESMSKEREVAEFCRSVDTGESVVDEGRHLKLLNQVVGAVKNEIKIKDELLNQLTADIKNDVATFEGLQDDFNRLETSLRSQHLKERGLESILKNHYNKVRDQDERMVVLEQQNQELSEVVNSKMEALKIVEEQVPMIISSSFFRNPDPVNLINTFDSHP
jgi:chromosome segregation ATPase